MIHDYYEPTAKEVIYDHLEVSTTTCKAIAAASGIHIKRIQKAMQRLVASGEVSRVGFKARQMFYRLNETVVVGMVPAQPGNSVFEECRANWQGYQLNQYLREVRA
ncbi:hypothetical protein [Buttiauxella gaviniae]|uniref:hypothetical protein n=1 Tax=Buttiauxella gaviniae TaxID=82990 RepID=UPI0039752456